MNLSTFQIILLAVFGSLGVGGMLIFALVTATGNTSTIGTVVIWGTLDQEQFNLQLRTTAEDDNRFGGVTYVRKDPVRYEAELTAALANGQGPDLFLMRQDYALKNSSYALHIPYTAMSESQFKSTFLESAEPFLATDGIIAVPLLADPLILYWNKDSLAAAGYANPPRYWNEIPPMVTKLVKKTEGGTVTKAGIALGEFDNIQHAKAILSTQIIQAGGGITGRDQNGKLGSVLVSKGGTTLPVAALNFFTEFANPGQLDYSWSRAFPEARSSFAAGDVALYIGRASERNLIARANPNLNFDIAAFPQLREGGVALNQAEVYGLALSRTSRNAQGALTIAYLIAAPEFTQPLSDAFGMTSALRRVLSADFAAPRANDETSSALQGLVSGAPRSAMSIMNFESNISRSWYDPDPEKTSAIFRAMIQDTVSGAVTSVEAVQRADRQLIELTTN